MKLGELVSFLSTRDPNLTVPLGFGFPHSHRGNYEDLAFKPVLNTTVGAMLQSAASALNKTYSGWKGGDYTMNEWTDCWLADWGCVGETLGEYLLRYMVGEFNNTGDGNA
jgi:hypothetical protein